MINAMLALSLVLAGVPAGTEGTHIRYAVQRVCGEKACGKLRLVLADGSAHELPDTSTGEGHEPVAVSADGSRVAYFRAGDRRLIAYELGGKRRFVGTVKQPANEVGVDETRLLLSPDGSRLAYLPNDAGRRIRVYDVRSGRAVGTLPAEDGFSCTAGFSGDGGELLRVEESMLIAARVTDLRGSTLRRDVPPQVVAHNLPRWPSSVADGGGDDRPRVAAAAADGRRLAVYVPGERPSMIVYDLGSRKVTARVPLPAGVRPAAATWTGTAEVTVRGDGGGMGRRVRVDLDEKRAEIVETYDRPAGGTVYHAGG
ncbi:hypothetical protein AB0K05_11025 [Nonomuraea sp. NPDC049486]|uniref:hypothetical protein n=1 Tax=Nonomuraea sp. NPDC049486 TaxID=3155773 RepID=UPI0034363977